jgi:hypothetical protein
VGQKGVETEPAMMDTDFMDTHLTVFAGFFIFIRKRNNGF